MRAERWFDAHEALEEEWRDAPAPERDFLQGLVHVTVAWHHASRRQRQRGVAPAREGEAPARPVRAGASRRERHVRPRPGRGGVRARRPKGSSTCSRCGSERGRAHRPPRDARARVHGGGRPRRGAAAADRAGRPGDNVVGPLRRQLLSGAANGNGADPAHPIVIRSALTVGSGSSRVRALLVTFRSRSGPAVRRRRLPGARGRADPAHLSPSVSVGDLLHGLQQGIDPGRGARPVRQRAARDHGDPRLGRRRARAPLPRESQPHRLARPGADPRRGPRRPGDPGVRERRAGRARPLPSLGAAQKTGSRPNHSSARLT